MVDLRTGLQPREDLAPIPPPVGEIVARARRRQARRRLATAVSALAAVALLGVAVNTVGGDTEEPDARTGPAAESAETTVSTAGPAPSSTTDTTAAAESEEAPTTTTPAPDAGAAAPEPSSPPSTAAPPADAPVTVVEDTDTGSGVGQVEFSDGWSACTTTCDKAPDGVYRWTQQVGATATVRFSGTSVVLFGVREPWAHVATVSIDGGEPVDVDFFEAPATAAPVEVFRSPRLGAGPHTLVLTMTARRNPASTGGDAITFDRAEITGG